MIVIQRCALTAHYERAEVIDGVEHHFFKVPFVDNDVTLTRIAEPLLINKAYTLEGRLVCNDSYHEFISHRLLTEEALGALQNLEPTISLQWVDAVDKITLNEWANKAVNSVMDEHPERVGNYVYGVADYADFQSTVKAALYVGDVHPNVAKVVFPSLMEKESYEQALVDSEGSLDAYLVNDLDFLKFLNLKRHYFSTQKKIDKLGL